MKNLIKSKILFLCLMFISSASFAGIKVSCDALLRQEDIFKDLSRLLPQLGENFSYTDFQQKIAHVGTSSEVNISYVNAGMREEYRFRTTFDLMGRLSTSINWVRFQDKDLLLTQKDSFLNLHTAQGGFIDELQLSFKVNSLKLSPDRSKVMISGYDSIRRENIVAFYRVTEKTLELIRRPYVLSSGTEIDTNILFSDDSNSVYFADNNENKLVEINLDNLTITRHNLSIPYLPINNPNADEKLSLISRSEDSNYFLLRKGRKLFSFNPKNSATVSIPSELDQGFFLDNGNKVAILNSGEVIIIGRLHPSYLHIRHQKSVIKFFNNDGRPNEELLIDSGKWHNPNRKFTQFKFHILSTGDIIAVGANQVLEISNRSGQINPIKTFEGVIVASEISKSILRLYMLKDENDKGITVYKAYLD